MSLFCDETKIKVTAGNGGNGCMSFRREKYIPKGGPDGGNGGKGGNVVFKVNQNINTLTHLDTCKQFRAEEGKSGQGQKKSGRIGKDLVLEIPLGTIIRNAETHELLCDLNRKNMEFVAAQGGRGGFGNEHFKSSIRQAPKFAELGEQGESLELELELKLVADVAIIGIPSCGKSTLISVISNAKPKIAAYPFTTLIPHLGIAKIHDREVIFADIPGLIEGAHRGKGLGDEFLRHIERTKTLIHLIDPTVEEDPLKNFELINKELEYFNPDLAKKPQIVVVNKIDVLNDQQIKELKRKLAPLHPHFISAATRKNLRELLDATLKQLENFEKNETPEIVNEEEEETIKVFKPHEEDSRYSAVERIRSDAFRISGKRIEQIAVMTNTTNYEALFRLYDVMKKTGIQKELKKLGVKEGDKLKIGKTTVEYHET